jgi:hypothetical protein
MKSKIENAGLTTGFDKRGNPQKMSYNIPVWVSADTKVRFAEVCKRLDLRRGEVVRTVIEDWLKLHE